MEPVYKRFKEPFLKVLHGLDGSFELYQTEVVFRPTWWQRLFSRAIPITLRFKDIDHVELSNKLDRLNMLTIYPIHHAPISVSYIYHINRHEIATDIKTAIEETLQTYHGHGQANVA